MAIINKAKNLILAPCQEKWFFKVFCSKLNLIHIRFHGHYSLSSMKPFPTLEFKLFVLYLADLLSTGLLGFEGVNWR